MNFTQNDAWSIESKLVSAFLPSDLDLTFPSLIQRRLESTHLLLAQVLHWSTCHPYRSFLGIEC